MPVVAEHLRRLAVEIGPRPATTDAEAEAADYIQGVMEGYGLEVERQEFECPRSAGGALALSYLLLVTAVAAAWWPALAWPAVVVAVLGAVSTLAVADGGGLVFAMPKGPSQNIVGRHVPRQRRGERLTKVVIVAHYDTAKAALGFSPAFVRNRMLLLRVVAACVGLVPAFLLLGALPLPWIPDRWLWYVAAALGGVVLLALLATLYRELLLRSVPGGNDNASGVAALLGCVEAIVPAAEGDLTGATQPMRAVQVREEAWADMAEAVAEEGVAVVPRAARDQSERYAEGGGVLDYAPAAVPEQDITELPDDFTWAEPASTQPEAQAALDFDTVDFDTIEREERPVQAAQPRAAYPLADESATGRRTRRIADSWGDLDEEGDEPAADRSNMTAPSDEPESPRRDLGSEPKRGGLWSRVRSKRESSERTADWLGVDDGFDARKEGRQIGSWDNFDDDDDGFGFKGGWAGDDPIGDPDFARNEAGRIRKRITESVDRALAEKEVWFVATGANGPGGFGMRALINDYADDLRGALIINLQAVGIGNLHWVTEEGVVRRLHCDRRLASTARRAASDLEIAAKGRAFREFATDATYALARRQRAMSIMAFDINGRVANVRSSADTADNVQTSNVEAAVRLVAEIVRTL